MPMNIKSTLNYSTESSFERQIRKSLVETYKNEKPSKKTLSTIMSFAASYDCIDTKFGKVEIVFN